MATVKFYPRKSTALEQPINLVFTIDREHRVEVATGERIEIRYWDAKKQCAKSSYRGHVELNQSLARFKDAIIQVWRDNKDADFEQLKRLVRDSVKYGDRSKKNSGAVLNALREFVVASENEKDHKTVAKYRALVGLVDEYDASLSFEELTFSFYDKFKAFLYTKPNPNYPNQYLQKEGDHWIITYDRTLFPVPIFDDSVFRHIITFKTFLKWASKRGYPVHPSFSGWEVIRRSYQPISLSLDELNAIEKVELKSRTLDVARDYFTFECRTGQRISDIKAFNPEDFDGDTWSFFRKKGSRLKSRRVTVIFEGYCAPALTTLIKHDFKLPPYSEQKLNVAIKRVCRLAGITKPITIERWAGNKRIVMSGEKCDFVSTHTGRKTFITIALQHMPPANVKDLTGIESYATLKHYEGESDSRVIRGYLNKIEEKPKMKVG